MILLVLAYALFFSPALSQLNAELKNTQAAMLMFPEEVVNGIPAVKKVMRELTKGSNLK